MKWLFLVANSSRPFKTERGIVGRSGRAYNLYCLIKWNVCEQGTDVKRAHYLIVVFRPIVSSLNTYNYNLASYLVSILQPISTNQSTIKDFFSFADWAKIYKHICLDKLYALPDPPTMPRLILLLEFVTKKSHFTFHTTPNGHPWGYRNLPYFLYQANLAYDKVKLLSGVIDNRPRYNKM